jgi:hypothetical protein
MWPPCWRLGPSECACTRWIGSNGACTVFFPTLPGELLATLATSGASGAHLRAQNPTRLGALGAAERGLSSGGRSGRNSSDFCVGRRWCRRRCSEQQPLRGTLGRENTCVRKRGEIGFQRGWWRPRQRTPVRRSTATATCGCSSRRRLPAFLDDREERVREREDMGASREQEGEKKGSAQRRQPSPELAAKASSVADSREERSSSPLGRWSWAGVWFWWRSGWSGGGLARFIEERPVHCALGPVRKKNGAAAAGWARWAVSLITHASG